jgi:hypothetical protein
VSAGIARRRTPRPRACAAPSSVYDAMMLNVLAAIGALGGLGYWMWSADRRERRRLTSPPRRDIRDVVPGELVRIVGRVEVSAPLEAPLTGRPCAFWRVIIRNGRDEHTLRFRLRERLDPEIAGGPYPPSSATHIADDQRGVEFVIDDGTGRALVSVSNAFAVLSHAHDSRSFDSWDLPPRTVAFLEERNIPMSKWVPLACVEGIAGPGDTIAVIGVATHEPDSGEQGRGYRDASTRVVMRAPTDGKLLVSDERLLVS